MSCWTILRPAQRANGVRVAPPVDEECPLVGTVGVKMDGTEEPPPVQAETVTARRIAPAAERPAIGHAPWPRRAGSGASS